DALRHARALPVGPARHEGHGQGRRAARPARRPRPAAREGPDSPAQRQWRGRRPRRLALPRPGGPRLRREAARGRPARARRGRRPALPPLTPTPLPPGGERGRGEGGRDLHVFSTGLRNIYDVALDEELNVFVRDNENDGGDYKIRVCHSFFGADHGYPYLYYERPDEALAPLADLGLGSSAGGVCYLERQFPAEYRGNLFFCEWGRAVVRYPLARSGASFAPVKEADFAAGAANDPYGFKPTDLVADRDGSLFVSDWADGQRPRRGRGRIYRVRYVGEGAEKPAAPEEDGAEPTLSQLRDRLQSESYFERCRAQEACDRRAKQGSAIFYALDK